MFGEERSDSSKECEVISESRGGEREQDAARWDTYGLAVKESQTAQHRLLWSLERSAFYSALGGMEWHVCLCSTNKQMMQVTQKNRQNLECERSIGLAGKISFQFFHKKKTKTRNPLGLFSHQQCQHFTSTTVFSPQRKNFQRLFFAK